MNKHKIMVLNPANNTKLFDNVMILKVLPATSRIISFPQKQVFCTKERQ